MSGIQPISEIQPRGIFGRPNGQSAGRAACGDAPLGASISTCGITSNAKGDGTSSADTEPTTIITRLCERLGNSEQGTYNNLLLGGGGMRRKEDSKSRGVHPRPEVRSTYREQPDSWVFCRCRVVLHTRCDLVADALGRDPFNNNKPRPPV